MRIIQWLDVHCSPWNWARWNVVHAVSEFSVEWFKKMFLHQVDNWRDYACFFNHHLLHFAPKLLTQFVKRWTDMVVAKFLEISHQVLSKLNCYHAVVKFPKDTVRDDIHRVINMSLKMCIYRWICKDKNNNLC